MEGAEHGPGVSRSDLYVGGWRCDREWAWPGGNDLICGPVVLLLVSFGLDHFIYVSFACFVSYLFISKIST